MASLSNKIAVGAAWMIGMRLAVRSIGLVSTLILLRLLEPRDFGIVAMVTAVIAAIDALRMFGFDIALIQNQHAGPDEYNTVWTMDLIFGLASGLIIGLVAQPAAAFYSEPALVPLFYVLAAANVIFGLRNVGIVDFRKHLQFDREFLFSVSIKVAGFIVTVGLAFWLRSYWALVIGMATTTVVNVVLSYAMHPYRPRLSLVAVRSLFRFSKWIFLNNMSIFIRLRGPDFIIGKLSGTRGLGLFTLAYEISNLPTSELVAPINRALLPGFSRISSDIERSGRAFVRAAAVVALFSLPMAFGIAATAELIGTVILGEKWLDAVPLLKILALSGAITAILSPIASALISLGRPGVVATVSFCNAVVLIPTLIFLTYRYGVYGAAVAVLIVSLVFVPVYFIVGSRYIRITVRDIATIFFRPGISAACMYASVTALPRITAYDSANLALLAVIGALVYAACELALWSIFGRPVDSAEAYAFDAGKSLLSRSEPGRRALRFATAVFGPRR